MGQEPWGPEGARLGLGLAAPALPGPPRPCPPFLISEQATAVSLPMGSGPGTWCPGTRGLGVALFWAGGSHTTLPCFPPRTLVPRGGWWVLRPPGPAGREQGEALTSEVSWGCIPRAAVSLLLSHWL